MKCLKDQSDVIAVAILIFALATPPPVVGLRSFFRDTLNRNLHLVHHQQQVIIVHE
jgi:hypothetical protein